MEKTNRYRRITGRCILLELGGNKMTVKQLIAKLKNYTGDTEVKIVVFKNLNDFDIEDIRHTDKCINIYVKEAK